MHPVFAIILILLGFLAAPKAQEADREPPTWWFGGSGAANLNFYSGTAQRLNSDLTTPAPFHDGFGAGLYLAPHVEYRHDSIWGVMLQAGYDDRRGTFDDVICPCGELATLSANVSYFSIEPSLRIAPFGGRFFLYAGPRLAFNWAPYVGDTKTRDEKTFEYTQEGRSDVDGVLGNVRGMVFSGQVGLGYDIPLASRNNKMQVDLSPFISYQPYYGQAIGSEESWAVSTLRVGATLKFGSGRKVSREAAQAEEMDVRFSVRAPLAVTVKRRVRETFPLRNYVFFEDGSAEIPGRYVSLTREEASAFQEEQLQEVQPRNNTGRSLRQMTVYYNILNTLGDRMKRSPGAAIRLTGSSDQGPGHGKARAETIKRYLVDVFGIDGARIETEGRDKPRLPSEMEGGTQDLDLLKAGNNRVDIESRSPELMIQVGGAAHTMLKPVQIIADVEDPLDAHVLFNVSGANEALASWSLEIRDDQGKLQTFGPYTGENASISGNAILGDRPEGDYKVVMIGNKKDGQAIRKAAEVRLIRRVDPVSEALRFSILYDYGASKSRNSYEKFLVDMVVPLISDNSMVVIHGYTDNIGEESYNRKLSEERVEDTRGIIEAGIKNGGKRGITFETFGFGEDPAHMPFDNNYPEERFYNRSVIIDIVPN